MNTVQQPKVNLRAFCRDFEYRAITKKYKIDEPFIIGNWKYSTDGVVCIRVPATGKPSKDTADLRFPPTVRLFKNFPDGPWEPWPNVNYKQGRVTCIHCLGGKLRCSHCDGDGCSKCYETGQQKRQCRKCKGQGATRGDVGRVVAGKFLQARYDKLIRALPGVEFFNGEVPSAGNKIWTPDGSYTATAVAFRFDGGQGMVMPRTPPTKTELDWTPPAA